MRKPTWSFLLIFILLSLACTVGPQAGSDGASATPPVPVVAISGATLIDGSGGAPIANSTVVIRGDRILSAGPSASVTIPPGATIVDGAGQVIAPGFIDIHNHSGGGLETDPSATTQVSQGLTTVVLGQDGESEFPIGPYLDKLASNPVALNVVTFVGHATVRALVMKDVAREANAAEIAGMQRLVGEGMSQGAFGLSSGLEYEGGKAASTEEMIALATVAGRHHGIYISHVRDEAKLTLQSFAELIRIAEEGHLPAQVSHIKMGSVSVWGKSDEAVRMIEAARARGLDITADCYPYDAWHSTIRVIVPSGNYENAGDVADGIRETGGPENILVVSCAAHPDYEFKTLAEIARTRGITAVELFMQIVRDGGAKVVARSMQEQDIKRFYEQPWVMVSSDGGIGIRHPRAAGAFPRVLGLFVREKHWLTLQEAIRKMTSMPAARLGINDRGMLRPGMKADLVLFDPDKVIDRSTFQEPAKIATGINRVWVNGIEVWDDGKVTKAMPGVPIRHRD
ncbi:MAG: D-aminoacylase [Acidobacteriota bacterium]